MIKVAATTLFLTFFAATQASAGCMANIDFSRKVGRPVLVIPIPPDRETDFIKRGYHSVPCDDLASDLPRFRSFACDLAQGSPAIQQQLEARFGMSGTTMCAIANGSAE